MLPPSDNDRAVNGLPDREREWERWRGEVTITLKALVRDMDQVLGYVEAQRAADAAALGESRARRGTWSWLAPNLPQLVSLVIAGVAMILSFSRMP